MMLLMEMSEGIDREINKKEKYGEKSSESCRTGAQTAQ